MFYKDGLLDGESLQKTGITHSGQCRLQTGYGLGWSVWDCDLSACKNIVDALRNVETKEGAPSSSSRVPDVEDASLAAVRCDGLIL